jgi:murein DD-endopeptidase MepM/ murein hydrolase activator NlpD
MKRMQWVILVGLIIGVATYFFFVRRPGQTQRNLRVVEWINHPSAHPDWAIQARQRCGTAPFLFPTTGYIGYLWGDTFQAGHPHQGIDIFGGTQPDVMPVYSVYDGYLTRLAGWKSSVIIRFSSDPLQPGRQIWTYYTHMADAAGNSFISSQFPPGTTELFVPAGTLLGHQGNYSGSPDSPVGIHLHFSIVKDDGRGGFTNELDINNTIDPSLYFGLPLNVAQNTGEIPVCQPIQLTPGS